MRVPRTAIFVICLGAGACSHHAKQDAKGHSGPATASAASPTPAVGADAGLEIATLTSAAPAHTLAATLAPYVDQPLPISHELQDVWDAHGLRMVSLPLDEAPAILAQLQSGGSQRQWLGQAYSWTEAARGDTMNAGSVVALDAERIRLASGSLRLLVRSWLEPAPPEPRVGEVSAGASGAISGAILRVELVPQLQELHPRESSAGPLAINEPRIEAESQGMIFSRLYARLSVPAGRALLILAEHPGVDWKRLAAEPEPPAPATIPAPSKRAGWEQETVWPKKPGQRSGIASEPGPESSENTKESASQPGKCPGLGEVRHVPPSGEAPAPAPSDAAHDSTSGSDSGPPASRVATLGEAMLSRPGSASGAGKPAPPQRTLVLLLPRVPREYRLLGPSAAATPPRHAAP